MIFKIKSIETQSNEGIYFSILSLNSVLYHIEDWWVSVLYELQLCSLAVSLAHFLNSVQYAACVCWIIKHTNKQSYVYSWMVSIMPPLSF